MATALYPGAYKPPHRGHFEVVKKLLDGTHNGVQYNLSDMQSGFNKALQGDKDEVEKIDKVIVFIGGGVRNGISEKESKQVWDIYAKYLPNVEIVVGEKNPLNAAKHYAAEHPDEKFYAVTGVRSEEDYGDLRRIATFKNTPNVQGLIFPATGNPIRATNLRQAVLQGSLDDVLDFFPSQLSRQEMLNIMNILKQSIIAEIMAEKLDAVLAEMFQEEEEQPLKENSSGTPIAPQPIMRSEDRAKLVRVYEQLRDTLGDNFYNIEFKNDHIAVYLKEKSRARGFDYTPYMASLLEYMIDSGMKISPLPEVKIKKDLVEAEDFFGKTAFYNPTKKEIVLYTQNRHPKDIMRSFAHEMIHHKQNLEGRLNNIGTTNTNEDDYLLEIEKEAYLEGNITFRNWEDSIKKKDSKDLTEEYFFLQEDELSTEVVNPDGEIFDYKQGKVRGLYTYKDSLDNLYFARISYYPANKPYFEFKVGWFKDNDITKPTYDPALPQEGTAMDNIKRRNTVAKIYRDEILSIYNSKAGINTPLVINPISNSRYIFSQRLVKNHTPGELFNIEEKQNKLYIYKKEKNQLSEGRYDKIANEASSDLFNSFKNGEKSYFGNFENGDLDFSVYGDFIASHDEEYFSIDGDADYDETGEGNDSIRLILIYNPAELPQAYKDISFAFKDVIRHEIEHLTHSDSDNLKSSKYMQDDTAKRVLIKLGKLPKSDYFKLEKEIDANIQGMYFRAKKEKRPFKEVVKQYFDDQNISKEDYEHIIDLMNKRLPALGIKQRL